MTGPCQRLPDIISKARARLLVRAPFFGSIALGLIWMDQPEIGTMATDGRALWFNTAWCEQQGVEKIIGVIAHEVVHVVNKHHLRRGARDPALWNNAADLMINRLLTDDGYSLPDDGLYDRDGRFAGLPTETIYARLLEERKQQDHRRQQQRLSDQAASQGTGTSGHAEVNSNGQPQTQPGPAAAPANRSDQNGVAASDAGGASDHISTSAQDAGLRQAESWGEIRDLTTDTGKTLNPAGRHQADQDLNVRIRQAAAAAKRAGKFGDGLKEVVEAATSRIDWQTKFRTIFDGTLRGDLTWARPNRRFIQHGLYLPGWRRTGAGRVAFVLDTSGSISNRELAVYTAAVLGILEETGPEQVALIQCDTAVRDVTYLHPGEPFDRFEVVGRGGTAFQPAFDWITASGFAPNIIIYATDLLCSDTPDDPGTPVIWLTPTRGRAVPFGDIVEVDVG